MGEILLAFTIITLTFIVIYLKRERSKKNQSLDIEDKQSILMKTPINCRKTETTNNNNNNFFNGTINHQDYQFSGVNSPFIASNPSYIKIKNINYNNINQVSPINNYSNLKNNDYFTSLEKTPNVIDQNNSNVFKDNLSKENYNNFEKKIKNINLIDNHDKFTNKDEYLLKKSDKFKVESFDNDRYKLNNSEKKITINNIMFTEIDFDNYRTNLNSEKKNVLINSLSKNISYYGVQSNFNTNLFKKKNFCDDTQVVDDLNSQMIQYESIKDSNRHFRKKQILMDYQVKKKLSFNTESLSDFIDKTNHDRLVPCSKNLHNTKNVIDKNSAEKSNILPNLNLERKNLSENIDNNTNCFKEPFISLKKDIKSSDFQNISENKSHNIEYRINESESLKKKNTLHNVSYCLTRTNKPNNKIKNVLISDHKLDKSNHNNCSETKIINNAPDIKNIIKTVECDYENKENDKNFLNILLNKRQDSMFSDLIPKKKTNEKIEHSQDLIINMNKKEKKNNNLSSIKEQERSFENNSSNKFFRSNGDSAKNISFGSNNKNDVRKNNPTPSNFILWSCLKEN